MGDLYYPTADAHRGNPRHLRLDALDCSKVSAACTGYRWPAVTQNSQKSAWYSCSIPLTDPPTARRSLFSQQFEHCTDPGQQPYQWPVSRQAHERGATRFRTRFLSLETGPAAVRNTHEGFRTGFGGRKTRAKTRRSPRMRLALNDATVKNDDTIRF